MQRMSIRYVQIPIFLKKVKNVEYYRGLKNLWKVFLQYCDYTSIGGFRFFTPLTPSRIRIPATFLFAACIAMVAYQILYTLTSYSGNTNVQYSTLVNSHFTPLPYIFICKPFGDRAEYPFWRECQDAAMSIPERVVTRCYVRMNGIQLKCEYRCVWSAQGFCFAVTPNISSVVKTNQNTLKESQVETFLAVLYIPEIAKADHSATPFEVYLQPYDETHTRHWSDTQSFSVRPSNAQLFPKSKTSIYISEHYELIASPTVTVRYEDCIWQRTEKLLDETNCSYTKFAPVKPPTDNFTVVKPSLAAPCVAEALRKVVPTCTSNKERYETYMCSMSVFEDYEAPHFYNDYSIFGNLEVYVHTTRSRVMYSVTRPQVWKLASDIGGTLSLYTGFTLMGIVETIFFLSSTNLRNLAAEDEQTAVERKNPPITNPMNKPEVKQFFGKVKLLLKSIINAVKTYKIGVALKNSRLGMALTKIMDVIVLKGSKIMAAVNNSKIVIALKNSKAVKALKKGMNFMALKSSKIMAALKNSKIVIALKKIKYIIVLKSSKIVLVLKNSMIVIALKVLKVIAALKDSKFVKCAKDLRNRLATLILNAVAKMKLYFRQLMATILKKRPTVHPKEDLKLTIPTDKK